MALLILSACGGAASETVMNGGAGGMASAMPTVSASDAGAGGVRASDLEAGAGGNDSCAPCPVFECDAASTPATEPGQCCPSSCMSRTSHEPVMPLLCEIDRQRFDRNGYRSCAPNDAAELAGICDSLSDDEFASGEVCGQYRIYAYGHDGRIGCAYDRASGELVGGLLWGLPVDDKFCETYVAGPESLASCPAPSQPICDELMGAGGARGNAGASGAAGSP